MKHLWLIIILCVGCSTLDKEKILSITGVVDRIETTRQYYGIDGIATDCIEQTIVYFNDGRSKCFRGVPELSLYRGKNVTILYTRNNIIKEITSITTNIE